MILEGKVTVQQQLLTVRWHAMSSSNAKNKIHICYAEQNMMSTWQTNVGPYVRETLVEHMKLFHIEPCNPSPNNIFCVCVFSYHALIWARSCGETKAHYGTVYSLANHKCVQI
jgi:hypothetical protein